MAGFGLGGFLVDVSIVGDLLDHEVALSFRYVVEALPRQHECLAGSQGAEGANQEDHFVPYVDQSIDQLDEQL